MKYNSIDPTSFHNNGSGVTLRIQNLLRVCVCVCVLLPNKNKIRNNNNNSQV